MKNKGSATLERPARAPAKPVVTEIRAAPDVPSYESAIEDLIRIRAYEKWEAAGKPPGCDVRFWHEAEEELLLGKRPPTNEALV